MITHSEYLRRVVENTAEWKKQSATKSFDITKYHGFDKQAGECTVVSLLKKTHDVYGAVVLGFLPYLDEQTGADAVKLEDNQYVDVELKTCYVTVTPNTAFRTARNTIYHTKDVSLWGKYVDRNKTQLIESKFSAAFKIKNNLHTKDRETYIIAIDGVLGSIIDVYYLEGKQVLKYLETSKDIKLGTFMKEGLRFVSPVEPAIGWQNWIDSISKTLEIKVCESKKTRERRLGKLTEST